MIDSGMFNTPILFLIFNRPTHAKIVFEKIRAVKPDKLYIAADGPRPGNDSDQINSKQTREEVLKMIDWECDVKTLFRNENLGCGLGPANAITWFFDQVEYGIILEDDCLPSISFFQFCDVMLRKFKDNEKVMAISGSNYLGKYPDNKIDYFFSDGGNWGWATWKRAWRFYDYELKNWPTADEHKRNLILSYYPGFEAEYQKLVNGQNHIWDLQWHYTRLFYEGLSISPSKNLVTNIGFDKNATHTFDKNNPFANVTLYELNVTELLVGPDKLELDKKYRKEMIAMSKGHSVTKRLINRLKKII